MAHDKTMRLESDHAGVSPRGWNKPVRPVALLLVGGAVLLIWLVWIAVAVWSFYEHWQVAIDLRQQPVTLRLPSGMEAMAQIVSPVRTHVDLQPRLRIPIQQVVPVQLPHEVQAQVHVKAVLPLETTVVVDQVLPIRTTVSTSVSLLSWLPRLPLTIPVHVDMPVHMAVPVKVDVPVDLDVSAKGELPPVQRVPVRATFDVHPHVVFDVTPHVLSQTAFTLTGQMDPIPLRIEEARLHVPFNLTLLNQRH